MQTTEMEQTGTTTSEQQRERTFVGFDGKPFVTYDDVTYTIRVDANNVVWLDYSDGRVEEAVGVRAKRVLRFAAKRVWKEITE